MVTYTTGGDLDWSLVGTLVIGPAAALAGVWLGWWLQRRTEERRWRWRLRTAAALMMTDLREVELKLDQAVNHQRRAPAATVTFSYPTFREFAGELNALAGDDVMGRLATVVSAADDMTEQYRRLSQPVPANVVQQAVVDLTAYLDSIKRAIADLEAAVKPFESVRP